MSNLSDFLSDKEKSDLIMSQVQIGDVFRMLIFMPLIEKFIVDARTETLYVPLNEETNPQD